MKQIQLTKGQVAIVDDDDYAFLSQFKWHAHWSKGSKSFYALKGHKGMPMHRLIMGNPEGMLVDHDNHNTLDNRKENLRVCTKSQNCKNRKKNVTQNGVQTSSKYKGVSIHPESGKWRALLQVDGKSVSLGLYFSEEDAALAYDRGARKHFGEFAQTNFEIDDGRPILGRSVTFKNNTSGYRGVILVRKTGKWRASICRTKIGDFDTKEDAAKAYDKSALERWGDRAVLNL